MKIILTCMLSILSLLPSISQAQIHKCTVAGKPVFTDQPCEGEIKTLDSINSVLAEKTPSDSIPQKAAYSSHQWYYGHAGYKRAVRLLKKYDAPIFIYFQADWCEYCRKLEKGLINTRKGKVALKKAIKVKITPENSKQDDRFFRSLGGNGYPAIYLQSNGMTNPQKIRTYINNKMLSASQVSQLIESQKGL